MKDSRSQISLRRLRTNAPVLCSTLAAVCLFFDTNVDSLIFSLLALCAALAVCALHDIKPPATGRPARIAAAVAAAFLELRRLDAFCDLWTASGTVGALAALLHVPKHGLIIAAWLLGAAAGFYAVYTLALFCVKLLFCDTERGGSPAGSVCHDHPAQDKPLGKIPALLIAASFSLLSFFQIIRMGTWQVLVTVPTAFICGFLFYTGTAAESLAYIRSRRAESLLVFLASAAILWQEYLQKLPASYIEIYAPFSVHIYRLGYWALALPALFFLLLWVWRRARAFLTELWGSMGSVDKRIYLAVSAAMCVTVLCAYASNSQWYLQYDSVYSLDAGHCAEDVFPLAEYCDVRHPTLSILTFPIWAVFQTALGFFVPSHLLLTLVTGCVQLVNIQLLLLSGLMLARLAGNRWVLLLYLISFPSFLFGMFLEKSQIIVFLMVLYVYLQCEAAKGPSGRLAQKRARGGAKKAGGSLRASFQGEGTELNLMLSIGALPVSVFLFVYELFKRESAASKLFRLLRTAAWGALFLVCTGRVHYLLPSMLLRNTPSMLREFGLQGRPLRSCCISFMNLIHGCFLAQSSTAGANYMWSDVLTRVSPLTFVILAVVLTGLAAHWRKPLVQFCAIWLAGAFVLLTVFQWSVDESPLFSVYFGWAVLVLFQKGMETVIEKLRWNEKTVYCAILIPMLAVNLTNMIDIGLFLKALS